MAGREKLNEIIALAIHDLERTQQGFDIKLSKAQLPVNKTTQRVVDELYDLYSRRASKSHGKFADDGVVATPALLKEYLDAKTQDFVDLTSKMMDTLQRQAGYRGAATGGHVFFAHFKREGREFVLVAIVTDKLGAALSGDLSMRDVSHLDIDGFRFAGRINLTGWAANEERYVGFLKGKGNVSDYFKEFLGCTQVVQAMMDTTDLVTALKDFTKQKGMTEPQSTEFLTKAKSICERAARDREELEFEALANELLPREPKTLVEFLAAEGRSLNDRFVPDRRALRSLVRYKAKTDQWSVEFEREALAGGSVMFNPKDDSLTFKNLPVDLIAQLKNDVVSRG